MTRHSAERAVIGTAGACKGTPRAESRKGGKCQRGRTHRIPSTASLRFAGKFEARNAAAIVRGRGQSLCSTDHDPVQAYCGIFPGPLWTIFPRTRPHQCPEPLRWARCCARCCSRAPHRQVRQQRRGMYALRPLHLHAARCGNRCAIRSGGLHCTLGRVAFLGASARPTRSIVRIWTRFSRPGHGVLW